MKKVSLVLITLIMSMISYGQTMNFDFDVYNSTVGGGNMVSTYIPGFYDAPPGAPNQPSHAIYGSADLSSMACEGDILRIVNNSHGSAGNSTISCSTMWDAVWGVVSGASYTTSSAFTLENGPWLTSGSCSNDLYIQIPYSGQSGGTAIHQLLISPSNFTENYFNSGGIGNYSNCGNFIVINIEAKTAPAPLQTSAPICPGTILTTADINSLNPISTNTITWVDANGVPNANNPSLDPTTAGPLYQTQDFYYLISNSSSCDGFFPFHQEVYDANLSIPEVICSSDLPYSLPMDNASGDIQYVQEVQITHNGVTSIYDDLTIAPELTNPGSYTIVYDYYTSNNTNCQSTYVIFVSDIDVTVPSLVEVCNGNFQPICVTNGFVGYQYTWYNNNVFVGSGDCFTPSSTGSYSVIVFDPKSNCEKTYTIKVKESKLISPNQIDDYNICMAYLTGHETFGWSTNPFVGYNGTVHYNWNVNGNPISVANDMTPWNIGFNGIGTYTVNIVLGCSNISLVYSFNVFDASTININSPFIINYTQTLSTVTFYSSNLSAYNVMWSVSNNLGTNYYYNVNSVTVPIIEGKCYEVRLFVFKGKGCKGYMSYKKWCDDTPTRNSSSNSVESYEIQEESKISIYPNPTTDASVVLIENFDTEKEYSMVIYSITGEIVIQQLLTESKSRIDLIDLENGVYFVEIFDGVERAQKKLVKAN